MSKKSFFLILSIFLFISFIFWKCRVNLLKISTICIQICNSQNHKDAGSFPSKYELLKSFTKGYLIDKTNIISEKRENGFGVVKNFLNIKEIYYDRILTVRSLLYEIFIQNTYFFVADKKDPFIIDCGSNIGMSVLYFKLLYPNAKIIAFEPCFNSFEILSKNIEKNNFKNVELFNYAVSDKVGKIKYYFGDASIDQSFNVFEKKDNKDSDYYISSTLLSNYIKEEVDLLKMDIEASELSVLQDLEKNKKLRLIKEIVMEYHHTPDIKDNQLSKLMEILERNNFNYQIGDGLIDPYDKKFPRCFCILHAYRVN